MKREVILRHSTVLTLVIGLAMSFMTACSDTSTAPSQGSSKGASGSTNGPSPAASPAAAAGARTPESNPPSAATAPQQASQASASPTPARAQDAPAAPAAADKFSGTWVLDAARSQGLVPGMNQVMSVTRAGDTMNVTTKLNVAGKGEWTVNDAYVLDGRATEFSADMTGGGTGAARGTRTSRLSDDGSGIEASEDSTMEAQGARMKVNITRTWKLSDDKTLVIEMTVNGPQGTQKNRRVFVRK